MSIRSRSWCLTINHYTDDDVKCFDKCGAKYYTYGKEVGATGTPHLQAYVEFSSQRTLKSVSRMFPRAHVEVRRGTALQAAQYCQKDGDYVEFGTLAQKNGGDSALERAEKNRLLRFEPLPSLLDSGVISVLQVPQIHKARQILDSLHPPKDADDVRGVWIFGPPGSGKTHAARNDYGDSVFIKAQNKWFDGYAGEKVIVLDDFDKQGVCLGHYLKIWTDKWSCRGEVKGGTINLVHEKFIITSNYLPSELWPDDSVLVDAIVRRFKIIYK